VADRTKPRLNIDISEGITSALGDLILNRVAQPDQEMFVTYAPMDKALADAVRRYIKLGRQGGFSVNAKKGTITLKRKTSGRRS